jgi:glycosyltransferase involved in cell wall biosynthesis
VSRRVVVATADILGDQMAGPAIRAWHLASALSAEHEVVLISTNRCTLTSDRFETRQGGHDVLVELVEWCDVFVFQGWILRGCPELSASDKVVVADVYDPMHLEQLEQARELGADGRDRAVADATSVLNEQLARADFVMCASEEQRTFWLGQLAAVGRLNPVLYDDDPTYRSFLDVVPFGLPDEPPTGGRCAIRGVIDGIGDNDAVVLWNGGVYNWFDPVTLIRAVDIVRHEIPAIRLVFMGMRHPNPDVPAMRAAADAVELSDELGLTGRHVFFNHDWVPFDQRADHLRDADVGVSTHLPGLETDFAFRTRVLDCMWAGLPMLVTEGGALSTLVGDQELGVVVPPGDVAAVAAGLRRLLADTAFRDECRKRIELVARDYRWSAVVRPLLDFCRHPRRAPDLASSAVAGQLRFDHLPGGLPSSSPWRRIAQVANLVDREGVGGVVRRARERFGPIR